MTNIPIAFVVRDVIKHNKKSSRNNKIFLHLFYEAKTLSCNMITYHDILIQVIFELNLVQNLNYVFFSSN